MKKAALLLSAGLLLSAAGIPLGKPFDTASAIPAGKLLKRIQSETGNTVRVRGRIAEVCQMMGCWIELRDPDAKEGIRVKVTDGEIMFPKDSAGRMAAVEGKVVHLKLSREQAIAREKHEAEEQGRKPRLAQVKETSIYLIQGTGAVIFE
jgi:hypothetical protein